MSHSIAKVRSGNPMWYFEHNYSALLHLLNKTQTSEFDSSEFKLSGTHVSLSILENTRYTYLVELKQSFPMTKKVIPDLEFKVRLYRDARLAEVVSYQGARYLKARYSVPNSSMFHPDEKRQSNILLYDWLSVCGRLNFEESSIADCQSQS